ncbi:MAG TPA: TetR-like C-terminal domain-containing protein [Edaphobacter sp.]|nr:TetR-like C-terminal domain-containing protein [Edaphobacter sp.]
MWRRRGQLELAFRKRWIEPRRKLDRQIFLLGIKAGEFRFTIDIAATIDAIYRAIYYRLLIGSGTLDKKYMDSLFHHVMEALIEQHRS